MRLLILRYIFCASTLRLHRSFRVSVLHLVTSLQCSPSLQPHCHPALPIGEVIGHASLQRLLLDLACILDVLAAFRDTDESVC